MVYGTVRCAACGSKNVMVDHEQSNFSVKKAAIGTAAIGVLGAAAGFIGDKKPVYKCKDCGMELSYCMDDATARKIDYAVMLGNADEIWKTLQAKYKNIESKSSIIYSVPMTSSAVEESAEKFIRNYIAEMQRRWTPEFVKEMSAKYDAETEQINQHKEKLEKFENEHNFVNLKKRLTEYEKKLEKEVKDTRSESLRLSRELRAKESELEKASFLAFMRKKRLTDELPVAKALSDKADEKYKLAEEKHKEAQQKLEQFEVDRKAEYEKAGLSLSMPPRTIVTNPRDIGVAYAGTESLFKLPDSQLAFDVYTKLILYLAQCDLYTYEVAKISKKICDRLGFTGLKDYDPGIKEINSRSSRFAIASATDNDELINLAQFGKDMRYPTPQYPGHKRVPIYPETPQRTRDNPYLIKRYEITQEGKAFLNSDLLYTTLIDNRYGIGTFSELFQFDISTKLQLPTPVENVPEEPMAVTEQTEKQDMTTQRPVISPMDELKKLKELLDMGIVTQEEFDAKKKQLLGL